MLALLVLAIAGYFVVGWLLRTTQRDDAYSYFLEIANASASSAEVTESVTGQSFTVGPGEDRTFQVRKQPKSKAEVVRDFKVSVGTATRTLRSAIVPSGIVVVDVTGRSCFAVADYGRRYHREGEAPLGGDPTTDIQVREHMAHRALFTLAPGMLSAHLGQAMPKTFYATGENPQMLRLIRVPCEARASRQTLYDYLVAH